MKTFLLLGSGELGKEFTISAKRYGYQVVAVDSYANAPAMQVADEYEVIDMLNGEALDSIVAKHKPDFIVPEIEAIRTERLYDYENQGIQVVPSAKAANYTMDRKAIRDLAYKELGLKTAKYEYATSLEDMVIAVENIGYPCIVKPLMSSSGKGQSTIKAKEDVVDAWNYAQEGGRGDKLEVIVEEFIRFESEITVLTVTQRNGKTLFCPPIGHLQERGDYQESWQPAEVQANLLFEAQDMARKVTAALTGYGIWGVEFFLTKDEVFFSELSPRPHDTGMVTIAGTQNFTEFELHLRAILGLDIPSIELHRKGANAVILATDSCTTKPQYSGLEKASKFNQADFRIFGKPSTRLYRRMGIGLAYGSLNEKMANIRDKAKSVAACIKVN
ncbi:MAG: formate-dependent phosphoribosylglycinamide formyltransferase [Bacteroidetes bacterium]|nr:formate-dependent phosphoribosylglycinamide formyltransferase [Bacteroidota bacterium]MCB0802414.1 formate-dependent phosphoribosylglycinamide formyltransferase [Flavobacteriales bacterium]NOG58260.1 formate-dependent phosphoribosylglycinamide formyltransferase [Bacteroidota bacterium]